MPETTSGEFLLDGNSSNPPERKRVGSSCLVTNFHRKKKRKKKVKDLDLILILNQRFSIFCWYPLISIEEIKGIEFSIIWETNYITRWRVSDRTTSSFCPRNIQQLEISNMDGSCNYCGISSKFMAEQVKEKQISSLKIFYSELLSKFE